MRCPLCFEEIDDNSRQCFHCKSEIHKQCPYCLEDILIDAIKCKHCGTSLVTSNIQWFYEFSGERKGPVSEVDLTGLVSSGSITYGNAVWNSSMSDWTLIENTVLRNILPGPPPLSGVHVNNTIVWILAFAPLIGLVLEYVVAGALYGNEWQAQVAVKENKFWYITLALNLCLCFFDERKLKKAGIDTSKFSGWVWLVPVYLYQRARYLKQNLAYFIVWIATFALIIFE